MLFHSPKNPIELKILHLNEAQNQRREDLMEATQGKDALKQFKKTMAKKAKQALKAKSKNKKKALVPIPSHKCSFWISMVILKLQRLSICGKKSVP